MTTKGIRAKKELIQQELLANDLPIAYGQDCWKFHQVETFELSIFVFYDASQ